MQALNAQIARCRADGDDADRAKMARLKAAVKLLVGSDLSAGER